MKPLAARATRAQSPNAFTVWHQALEMEKKGIDMIHLEIGEPEFSTPEHIVIAAEQAMRNGRTGYESTAGTISLREAISAYLQRSRNLAIDPNLILVTPGVKGGLFFSMMALIEPGDECLIPDPGYPPYADIIRIAGGVPVPYPLLAADGYEPNIDAITPLVTSRTKAILTNSPSNPLGTIHSRTTIDDLAEFVLKHDLWLITDEIYAQLHFVPQFPSTPYIIPELHDRMILLDGFSKPYAMTGWRLGFGVFPASLIEPIVGFMRSDHSCIPPFIQDAGVAALNGPQTIVANMCDIYSRRAMIVTKALRALALDPIEPQGAFYVTADVSRTGIPVNDLVESWLQNGVAVLPGGGFGSSAAGLVRFSLTRPDQEIFTALERIAGSLQ